MVDWWSENGPPVYLPVAGYFGLIKKKKADKKPSSNLDDLARQFSGSNGIIQ